MLSYLGFTATCTHDGGEAVEIYTKDLESTQDIKVITSRAYSDHPTPRDYREAGCAGIIAKPQQLLDLSRVMAEALGTQLSLTSGSQRCSDNFAPARTGPAVYLPLLTS